MDDLRVLVFLGLWESSLLAYVSPGIVGYRIPVITAFRIGLIHSIAVYLLRGIYRWMGWALGTHTLICLVFLLVMVKVASRARLGVAAAGTFFAFQVLLMGEVISYFAITRSGSTVVEMLERPWVHIGMGWIGTIPLLVLSSLIRRYGINVLRLPSLLTSGNRENTSL
jgi:hypothetical protein